MTSTFYFCIQPIRLRQDNYYKYEPTDGMLNAIICILEIQEEKSELVKT